MLTVNAFTSCKNLKKERGEELVMCLNITIRHDNITKQQSPYSKITENSMGCIYFLVCPQKKPLKRHYRFLVRVVTVYITLSGV